MTNPPFALQNRQAFYRTMAGVPEHLLWPMWQLYRRVVANVVDNAMAEFEDLAAEVHLKEQLADVEALALARGAGSGVGAGAGAGAEGAAEGGAEEDPSEGPAAAAAAARVAAKRAERAALQDALAKVCAVRAGGRAGGWGLRDGGD